MIGKKKINQIRALSQKKVRQKEQLFLAEGNKIVTDLLNSPLKIKELFATTGFINQSGTQLAAVGKVSETEFDVIKKMSLLKNPQQCLALCHLPSAIPLPDKLTGLAFYLDGIQDPGNFGTIIRIADWFAMEYLYCSPDTADVFNPKVIQASMGSFCRVKTVYATIDEVGALASGSGINVFGTFMEGTSIYSGKLPTDGIIILGNEGNGISLNASEKITSRLTIPAFREEKGAESLNVAVAAGIIASEFRRQAFSRPAIQNEN